MGSFTGVNVYTSTCFGKWISSDENPWCIWQMQNETKFQYSRRKQIHTKKFIFYTQVHFDCIGFIVYWMQFGSLQKKIKRNVRNDGFVYNDFIV